MAINWETKLSLGAPLATISVVFAVLSPILGWSELPRPWGFLLGFATGVCMGIGAVLSTAGLVERRRAR